LEPCLMCMGALMQARVDRLVFGTFDPKAGARGSRMEVASGVLQEECSKLLKSFFKSLRKKNS
ncbi:MAG: nucleoside deaminase, partial [Deltaproteobacteria bacterium]|nr:nucleoside deaminase [Deltaproteobacteria bacterium]